MKEICKKVIFLEYELINVGDDSTDDNENSSMDEAH